MANINQIKTKDLPNLPVNATLSQFLDEHPGLGYTTFAYRQGSKRFYVTISEGEENTRALVDFQTGDQFALNAKIELLKRGESVAGLARKLGCSRTSVSLAINRPGMFLDLREKIRKELGLA